MNKKLTIMMVVATMLLSFMSFGQQTAYEKIISKIDKTKYKHFEYSGYDRKAFSIFYINKKGDKDTEKIGRNFSFNYEYLSKKFDYNTLTSTKLSGSSNLKSSDLKEILNQQNIPNKVMDYLMDEGNWDMPLKILNKRATANKSDAERQLFEKTFAGKNINDLATDFYKDINPVIKSNYIMTLSAHSVKTYKKHYDEIDSKERARVNKYNAKRKREDQIKFKPVKRTYEGYIADLDVAVFKIDLSNDSLLNIFWTKCYSDRSFRSSYNYPLKLIISPTFEIHGRQRKDTEPKYKRSMAELYKQILTSGSLNGIIEGELSEYDAFKVMQPVVDNKPISVKIGTQEELEKDTRYGVYVQEQYKKDKVRWKRQGVIRAKKVTNNNEEEIQDQQSGLKIDEKNLVYQYKKETKKDTAKTWIVQGRYLPDEEVIKSNPTKKEIKIKRGLDENNMMIPSTFYQTEGKKIDGAGTMIAIEYPALDLFPSLSYGTHGLNIRLSYLERGYKGFLEFNFGGYKFEDEPYIFVTSDDSVKTNVSISTMNIGVSKDFYFLRNFVFEPHLSIGIEGASFSNDELDELVEKYMKDEYGDDSYGMSKITFNVGVQLGYKIFHRIKAFGRVDYFPVSFKKDKVFGADGVGIPGWEVKRSPVRIYLGLRFEL